MRKKIILACALLWCAVLLLSACGAKRELVDMEQVQAGDHLEIHWEGRTYVPFCVVSKADRGEQIGYLNGDTDDRISAYKTYPPEEWLVGWLPMDGGALLWKETSVVDIPDGLVQEYN